MPAAGLGPRDEALALVRPGGLYVVDDLAPRADWAAPHREAVDRLVAELRATPGWIAAEVRDASGLMVCARS